MTVMASLVLIWFLMPTKPLISPQAAVDANGRDVLRLTCEACPDGSVMTVDGVEAVVADRVASIVLPKPFELGDNRFVVHVDRGSMGRATRVETNVPLSFRVRPDLTGLDGDPPFFQVEVRALPDASISVDGTSLQLNAEGVALHAIDVSEACTGPLAEVARLVRAIPYTIQPKGGEPINGTVSVSIGVTPLVMHAPRPRMVLATDHYMVSGEAPRGAMVEIDGRKLTPDADGVFLLKMEAKAVGETSVRVRALLAEHAPRTVVFTVKRVSSLAEEGKTFAQRSTVSVSEVLNNPRNHQGVDVMLQGEVVEERAQGGVRIILLDALGACSAPPCLVQVMYSGLDALAQGNRVQVFGRVAGVHESDGRIGPKVDADFLIKKR